MAGREGVFMVGIAPEASTPEADAVEMERLSFGRVDDKE
jgi:hypothetical protein